MLFLQTEDYYIYVVLCVTNNHVCRHGSPTELWAIFSFSFRCERYWTIGLWRKDDSNAKDSTNFYV